ncbi:MAG: hypothetical protein KAR47_08125, partial [Planctomycetes bacterium]|nr:hypothetical protein [Planctomycetota bacterium]
NESDVVNMTGFKVTDVESPYEPNQAFVLTLSTYNLNDDSSQSERDLYWSTAAVYYWRIVGNVDGGDPLISPVQSFGVDQYDLIDNFSDYDNGFDNRKGKWSASGGATITWINSDPPGTPGYGGNNLEMVYNDNAGASRATFLFVEPRDWSPAVNRHVISFQFLGFDGNDREDVYFTVTDTSNNSHSEAYDPNEFEKYYGNPWLDFGRTYFDLAPFADAGVNLSSVKSYGYGIGDGLEPMGQGTVHFDGGQIWSRHCRAGKFDYMFAGGDCNVDANEVLDLVERWLAVPETIIAAGSIPSDSLELHFTFDDDTTTDTLLSSNELAGLLTLDLNAGNVFQVTPGLDGATGGCIEVSRITEIRKRGIEGTLSNANPSCSASIWLKGNDVIGEDFGNLDPDGEMDGLRAWRMRGNNLVNGGGNSWILDMRVPHDDGGIEMRMDSFDAAKSQQNLVFDQDDTVPADWQGQWNHLAFTWDGVSGTTALYHNGRRVDREGFDADDYEDKAGVFMGELIDRINLPDNNRYTGLIDEFRFYSRVLTHSEVLALAGEASMEVPVDGTGADTNNDGVFNMADLAEISAHWGLREVLWP